MANETIASLSDYWARQRKIEGRWMHPDDAGIFGSSPHSFNLDFPAPAFVGDIVNARIIILMANGGYSASETPQEFPDGAAVRAYMTRLANPASADWQGVAPYYDKTNYAHWLHAGTAAVVNACAYRSRKISEEKENQRLIKRLPSARFTRDWLMKSVLPLAVGGERIIVGKRYGHWKLPEEFWSSSGVIKDTAPVSANLSKKVIRQLEVFLQRQQ